MEPFSHSSTPQERWRKSTSSIEILKSGDVPSVISCTPKPSPSVSGPLLHCVSPVLKEDPLPNIDRNPSKLSKEFPESITSPHLLPSVGFIHSHCNSGSDRNGERRRISSMIINREEETHKPSVNPGSGLPKHSDPESSLPKHSDPGSGLPKHSELESRIVVQADINKELKRLLVASIGSDLQHRVNLIAQEKAVAAHELDISLRQINDNEEVMDRLSIECDIWRSKFLASRLMIDELATWKAAVSQQLRESQRALQQLLQEHLEMKRLVLQCSYHLDGMGM